MRYGAAITLPDLRIEVARCPHQDNMLDNCGIHYVDLEPIGDEP
jgi:hypothetical protein